MAINMVVLAEINDTEADQSQSLEVWVIQENPSQLFKHNLRSFF